VSDPKTIKEAVEQLQASIQAALPGMGVTVSINMVPLNNKAQEPVNGKNEVAVKTDPITLDNLRALLNAYVKTAGKDKALNLVGKYSNGTKNPADIPEADYPEIIKAMGGHELEPAGDA